MQLTQSLHRNRRNAPQGLATVDGGARRTWSETVDRIAARAGALQAIGIGAGDRVALLGRNSSDLFEAMMATLWAGAVMVPLNVRWSAAELNYALRDCGARVLLRADEFHPQQDAMCDTCPALQSVGGLSGGTDAAPIADVRASGSELAAILYTGGTTGRSKGVMLSHGNLMASALGYAGHGECAPGASILHTAPMFHIGCISAIVAALLRGSTHVFLPAFEPLAVIRTIAAEGVTDTFLVPTMLQMVLDHPDLDRFDLTSLERILYGASPITPVLMDRAMAALPQAGFVQAYGMTELSPVVTLLSPSDHGAAGQADGRIRSAGRATMTVEVIVVGPDDTELPRGEVGEIAVRGPTVMQGYWNRPEETTEALRGGWMHTGDASWMGEDGYLHVVDRLKDMIISGGENVYSAEVERVLSEHPAVAQCAIVGVPDPVWGERVHAVIVPTDVGSADANALSTHLRERIAGFKCPKSYEFREALPLSPVGKVLKVQLRSEALARAD